MLYKRDIEDTIRYIEKKAKGLTQKHYSILLQKIKLLQNYQVVWEWYNYEYWRLLLCCIICVF